MTHALSSRLRSVMVGLLVFLFSTVLMTSVARANSIDSIEVDVVLKPDGSAQVTQVWDVEATEGTEIYIPQENLRDIEFLDFRVSEGNILFEDMGTDWPSSASRSEKAGKSGVIPTSRGFELVWGIGEYGRHTYTLTYTMTNVVQSFSDHDGFLIRFVNDQLSTSPREVVTRISVPDVPLSTDNARIWAFGYRGTILFEGGGVVARSTDPFTSASHMTIMMRFEKGVFSPTSTGDGTFEDLRQEAFIGSEYTDTEGLEDPFAQGEGGESVEDGRGSGIASDIGQAAGEIDVIPTLLTGVAPIAVAIIVFRIFLGLVMSGGKMSKSISSSSSLSAPVDPSYFWREVPMEGYLPAHYYLAAHFDPVETKDLIAGYILRWIRSGAARMETVTETRTRFFIFDREHTTTSLVLDPARQFADSAERELYDIFLEAAQYDNVLEDEEFAAWSRDNYKDVLDWLKTVEKNGELYARDNDFIATERKKVLFIEYDSESFTPAAAEAAKQVKGFQKFITDFTLIKDNPPGHVQVWDNYIIVAALYGLAEKAMETLKGLYPEYQFAGTYGNDMDSGIPFWVFYSSLSNFAENSTAGAASYGASEVSTSFGGGGGSSFGGGGGFSGGGSGGGFR